MAIHLLHPVVLPLCFAKSPENTPFAVQYGDGGPYVMATDWMALGDAVQDFCQWQTFNGTCPHGSVIVIDHAVYGRMRFGRCLDRDYGYLGCSVSVQRYVEQRCSGRRHCHISLPDAYLDNVPKPCPSDLKAYLELSYHCLAVETASEQTCRVSSDGSGLKVTKSLGYLSNFVTTETNKGSPECPWIIEGKVGQRFTLSLIDYGAPPSDEKTDSVQTSGAWVSSASSSGARGKEQGQLCHIYAQIHESTTHSNVVVCSGQPQQRDQVVYTSESNVVRVELINVKAALNPAFFLLKYEASGCADYVPPMGATANRNADRVHVHCDPDESISWELRCESGNWIGRTYNCSTDESLHASWAFEGLLSGSRFLSRRAIFVVIVIIATLVSVAILISGIVYIRRRRSHFRRRLGDQSVECRSTSDPDGTGRYKEHQYPMLVKPETVYPSSRHHPHEASYMTTTGTSSSRLPPPNGPGNMFVADFYTGYLSADAPSGGGGVGPGGYPSTTSGVGIMTSHNSMPLPSSHIGGYCGSRGVECGFEASPRFYGGATEHIYESPKFDRKSVNYDDGSFDDVDAMPSRFKMTHPR